MAIGVFVARFQPLHKSHEFLIHKSMEENDKTYVFISSADKARTKRNPLNIEERLGIFRKVFSRELVGGHLFVQPLDDRTDENDTDTIGWGNYLYDKITSEICDDNFTIYYSDDPAIMLSWFSEELKQHVNFRFFDRKELFAELSATKIREALLSDEDGSNKYLLENLPIEVYQLKDCLANIIRESNN